MDFVVSSEEVCAGKEGLTLATFGIEMGTAAETVEGGSKERARSMILFSAPD